MCSNCLPLPLLQENKMSVRYLRLRHFSYMGDPVENGEFNVVRIYGHKSGKSQFKFRDMAEFPNRPIQNVSLEIFGEVRIQIVLQSQYSES